MHNSDSLPEAPDSVPIKPIYNGSALRFAGSAIVGIAIFAGVLAAMGARFDNQNATPDSPSTAEVARQDVAELAAIAQSSATSLASADANNETFATVAAGAAEITDVLGGVWVAWPSGAPSGYTNDPVNTAAPADVTSADLVSQLVGLSDAALSASDNAAQSDRATYNAVALLSRFLAIDLANTEGVDSPGCWDFTINAAGSAAASETTLEVADAARQWFETDASNMAVGDRDDQLARIDSVSRFEEAILETGTKDSREAFAAYPDLAEKETLTSVALGKLSSQLLNASAQADSDGRQAILGYTCSLYLSSGERSTFSIADASN